MCVREDGKVTGFVHVFFPLGSGIFLCNAIVAFMSLLRKDILYVHLGGKSLLTDFW